MEQQPSRWRHLVAGALFAWGQSCTYWGHKLVAKRLYEWAVDSYGRALIYRPGWSKPLLRRAVIRGRELDDYTGAVRDLSQVIELDPGWADAYLHRGLLYAFHGLQAAPQAIADFERFLELAPNHAWRADAEQQMKRLQAELSERATHRWDGTD